MNQPVGSKKAEERWISQDFGVLAREVLESAGKQFQAFDVVVIGSGYGGAIAAAELAGSCHKDTKEPISVCVLERGKEYLPGMFPSRLAELPEHVRLSMPGSAEPAGIRQGLFSLSVSTDMSAIVANGLGGGSLINAGVMEIPRADVFDERWPGKLRGRCELDACYETAKQLLGAKLAGKDNTISSHQNNNAEQVDKHRAFARLAGKHDSFRQAAITVAMQDGRKTTGNVRLNACKLCGDCATGCNYSAKESLDTNLLVKACANGAQIYTNATVLRIDRENDDGPWSIFTTFTRKNQSLRQGEPIKIKALKVILAAGTLGSTEILLRSQQQSRYLSFSAQLGQGFSGNGDMIAAGFAQNRPVNAIAQENTPPAQRDIGPTITGIIDAHDRKTKTPDEPPLLFEALAVPGSLRRAFEEVYTTANMLQWLGRSDGAAHKHEHPANDPFAVNQTSINNAQIFASMGNDGAQGKLRLNYQADKIHSDGAIGIQWPGINKHPLFEKQIKKLEAMVKTSDVGGTIIPNPIWRLLPESMKDLIEGQRGPLLTVHPLGGCRMADDINNGVVNDCGQVFDARQGHSETYKTLAVLDGAIIPCALETNPALTIAATSLRAIGILQGQWGMVRPSSNDVYLPVEPRQVWRDVEQEIINRPSSGPTVGEFTERLSGPVTLQGFSGREKYIAEITLFYEPVSIPGIVATDGKGRLQNPVLKTHTPANKPDKRQSKLRIFRADEWNEIREKNCSARHRESLLDEHAVIIAPVDGDLTIMRREPSTACKRRSRAFRAWALNRGIRDIWQSIFGVRGKAPAGKKKAGIQIRVGKYLRTLWRMASHAAEVRLFEYRLDIREPEKNTGEINWPEGQNMPHKIRGVKRITYARPSNPWRQLMEMTVLQMPGLTNSGDDPVLVLDNSYMANNGIPLFRILKQENQVTAMSDLIALAGYIVRMLFSIHIWQGRHPEPPLNDPNRLPGKLPGIPDPEIVELEVDRHKDEPVKVRLTHYPARKKDAIPVAMFHGYSASGTTFAHPAPPGDITRTLHAHGRDVWVVDLRTSCGMPTAALPWTFERVGLQDIPAAIDYIHQATGGKKIDVLAHCMGSVMFSMAALSAGIPARDIITPWDPDFNDRYRTERDALPDRIRRAVLSQVGPLVVFSPRNVFSAYVTNYLRYFLPVDNYQFRPSVDPGLAEQLMDRLLATLPYPDDEILLENPAWPPWRSTAFTGTRHRMDAMYGRDFKLANLDRNTLEFIDDYFGPLNAETVSQVIHFTRLQMISNRFGRNRFVMRKLLRKNWKFPTMSIHGEENGLSDVATLARMESEMKQADRDFETFRVKNFGHQDCWIGKDAASIVFPRIVTFLDQSRPSVEPSEAEGPLILQQSWAGPVIGMPARFNGTSEVVPVSLSAKPSLGRPEHVILLPVVRINTENNDNWCPVYNGTAIARGGEIPADAMHIVTPGPGINDWFRIDVPAELFKAPAEGVLILTAHDQSLTLTARTFDENF